MTNKIISNPASSGWYVDPATGRWRWGGAGGTTPIPEAPDDGKLYGRKDEDWQSAAPESHTHSEYLTSFTESDPTVPAHVKGISTEDIAKWNTPGSAPVASVNGKTGAVNLTYTDVGAQVAGSYAASNHTHSEYSPTSHNHNGVYQPAGSYAASNHSHSGYMAAGASYTKAESNGRYELKGAGGGGAVTSVNGKTGEVVITQSDINGGPFVPYGLCYSKAETDAGFQVKGSYAASNHSHSDYLAKTAKAASAAVADVASEVKMFARDSSTRPIVTTSSGTVNGDLPLFKSSSKVFTYNHSSGEVIATSFRGNGSQLTNVPVASHTHSGYAASSHTHSDYLGKTAKAVSAAVADSSDRSRVRPTDNGNRSLVTTSPAQIDDDEPLYRSGIGGLYVNHASNIIVCGGVSETSDATLKSNVEIVDGSKVYDMRGVSYTMDGREQAGVIAQEMLKVAPVVVYEGAEEGEYMGVTYTRIIPFLIEAIKDLKAEVDELKGS